MGFIGFNLVLLGFTVFSGFHWGFTGFLCYFTGLGWVFIGFNRF